MFIEKKVFREHLQHRNSQGHLSVPSSKDTLPLSTKNGNLSITLGPAIELQRICGRIRHVRWRRAIEYVVGGDVDEGETMLGR
jgi:hypothetical protein